MEELIFDTELILDCITVFLCLAVGGLMGVWAGRREERKLPRRKNNGSILCKMQSQEGDTESQTGNDEEWQAGDQRRVPSLCHRNFSYREVTE